MSDLRRVLGPFDATCIVVGAIIGVGIFYTPSSVASLAGSGTLALLAWGVGGVIALCGALAFAELGARYPNTAGQYEALRDSYGSLPAFMFVFCYATVIIPGAVPIIAIICVDHLGVAVTGEAPGTATTMVAAGVLTIGLAIVNVIGVRWGAGVQNLTVVAKLAALLGIVVFALISGEAAASGPVTTVEEVPRGWAIPGAIFAAFVPVFFSYGGWQQVLWMGGEIRNPARNVPRAVTIGVIIVVGFYLVANWAYLHLLGPAGVAGSETLAADAIGAAFAEKADVGDIARRVVAAAVGISAFGVLNVQFMTGPRLIQGLAADGRFFRAMTGVHARFGTPVPALCLLAAMSMLLLVVAATFGQDPIDQLLTGVVFVDCVFFALTGAAVIVLRRRRPHDELSVRVPLYPLVPIVFVLGEIAILTGAYLDAATRAASFIGLAWLVVAACMWLPYRPRT